MENLTEQSIKKEFAKKRKKVLSDRKAPGLIVEVRPTGSATYFYRYRNHAGLTRSCKLARFREISLKDARSLAREKASIVASGHDPQEEKNTRRASPTLKEYAEECYLPHAKSYKRSWKTDEIMLNHHALPTLGTKKMSDINRNQVEAIMNDMKSRGYAPSTVDRVLTLISYMFKVAMDNEIPGVVSNPTEKIKRPVIDNKIENYLTREEVNRMLEAARRRNHPHIYSIIRMAVLTGARKAEILSARFEDFDLDNKIWNIPKGKNGSRKVILAEKAVQMVKELPKQEGTDLLFPQPGTDKPYQCIQKPFKAVLRDSGIDESVRFHDLRHSYASLLVQGGVNIYEVKELLGHSQITTTMRYAHLSAQGLRNHSNRLAETII
ncbi:site-specific integrase [Halorhodospira halophila]|uniref:Phage integrase family protein n=1 Tax=Halorhodospira halophila (strain DSM 244 / SL1) TaxID=349124 RepID=A1WTV4_HALHL|nr:site-specific integrase [Halorhodospira halophila]ABM61116.1 phage integrase family protein [Halorhodospira halophila SL1]MBK1729831.1 hypothetical protein [Halorhodospira halophila]